VKIVLEQENLRFKREYLEFAKIYKTALKEGILIGIDLDV
jgi:hypothetical protein